ncbi:MAG: hypothetical protein V3U80_10715 [Flavobacteriaceae bacterium]
MLKIISLIIGLLAYVSVFSQNIKNSDIDSLKTILLKKDYLFHHISKKEFTKKIDLLNNKSFKKDSFYWELSTLLTQFKDPNLRIFNNKFDHFPFEVKRFKSGVFITKIDINFEHVLGYKLIGINNNSIKKIINKIQKTTNLNPDEFLNNKPLFSYLNTHNEASVTLELLSDNQKKEIITIPLNEEVDMDNLIELIPDKIPFFKQKSDRWFWSYGINYGQQLYVKYNTLLSKEYFNKMKDSLLWTEKICAKKHAMGLQRIYDAPSIDDFHNKVILKFDNKRYKKLFIDFRNNKKGHVWVTKKIINSIKNHRRLKRKKRVYLLLDKSISSATINTILEFQKHTKAVLVGEKVFGTINNSNDITIINFPKSQFKISFPNKQFKKTTLNPCIYIEQTIHNYKNGIDPILQKALDN